MVYTPTTFNTGNPPGLDAGFFNLLQAWLTQFEGTTGSVSVNGGTSGTAVLYQILQGTVKIALVVLNNFHNGPAGDKNLALPTPFTAHCLFWSGDSGPFDLKLSGTSQTVWIQTAFPGTAGNGGTDNSATNANSKNNGHLDGAFDTVGLWGSQSSTFNGSIFLIGV